MPKIERSIVGVQLSRLDWALELTSFFTVGAAVSSIKVKSTSKSSNSGILQIQD